MPPSLKAKVVCQVLKATLTASCLVLLAGDVSVNPGPFRDPCGVCSKGCRKNQKAIQCDDCEVWFHAKCTGVTNGEYANLSSSLSSSWSCMKCMLPCDLINCNDSDTVAGSSQIPNTADVTLSDNEGMCLRRGFKIAHLNINRQVNKMDGIRNLIMRYINLMLWL